MFNTDLLDLIIPAFDWDKEFYTFNRDEKDMHPYSIINDKTSTTIVHNVLGIDKKDLKLSCEKEGGNVFIVIKGQSIDEITKKKYSINSRFAIDPSQLDLTTIKSTVKNGLLYITIPAKVEKEENKKIEIKIS